MLDSARLFRVHPRQLYRWREKGLTVDQADELAVLVGVHPSEVWGDVWWARSAAS